MYVHLESFNFKKISMISSCVIVFGIFFGYIMFPPLLKKMLKSQIHLKPGSQLRAPYTKAPFGIDFRVYMFNLTNLDEVHAGGKPKLQEIGPYFFEEWKEKFNLEDNEEEDILKYNFKNTFIFRPELSGPGLTGDEVITMPHPLIMGMALAINVERAPMLPLVAKAINAIFHEPKNAFLTASVMDILYHGIQIDCSSTEFAASAVCSAFAAGEAKPVRPINDTTYAFSFFDFANGTNLGTFEVFRGYKDYRDLGRVVSFDGETEIDVWPTVDEDDECNKYVGTDSTIFPPLVKHAEPLFAFEPSICRSLAATYQHPSEYDGIPTKRYGFDLGHEVNTPKCFCRFPPEGCPPKGTFDLYHCVKTPMFGSLPHFYDADPELVSKFASGIEPNEEKHAIFLEFESLTGSPLAAARRLQFNLEIVPIEEIESMKNLQSMLYPLFWVEESVQLNRTWTGPLKHSLFLMIKIKDVLKWICIIFGAIGMIGSAGLHYKSQLAAITVAAPANRDQHNLESNQNISGPTLNGVMQKGVI